jgi:hypothetical protein
MSPERIAQRLCCDRGSPSYCGAALPAFLAVIAGGSTGVKISTVGTPHRTSRFTRLSVRLPPGRFTVRLEAGRALLGFAQYPGEPIMMWRIWPGPTSTPT